jgi:hypothetical protein
MASLIPALGHARDTKFLCTLLSANLYPESRAINVAVNQCEKRDDGNGDIADEVT